MRYIGKVDEKLSEMGKMGDNLGEMVGDIQSFHFQIKVQNALVKIFEQFFYETKKYLHSKQQGVALKAKLLTSLMYNFTKELKILFSSSKSWTFPGVRR